MDFSVMTPGETLFGWGRLRELPATVRRYGSRVAVARGGGHYDNFGLHALFAHHGITVVELSPLSREPEPEDIDSASAIVRDAGVQAVLAIGGGSVIDLGKAVAALAAQHPMYPVRVYLEDIGEGRVLERDPLPFIAVPTTAGTGSEATKNAVISSRREGFKKSLRDRRMLADVVIIDPELTVALPAHLTAWTGMDALTQLIEAYTSCRAQPVTDALALQGISATHLLPQAVANGSNRAAREEMALAAYLSGLCLANAGLGAAHGMAAALGSFSPIPHGLACALALPWVMAANLASVEARYARVAEALTGETYSSRQTAACAAVRAVWELSRGIGIPRAVDVPALNGLLADELLPELARRCHGNSLRGNPRELTDTELVTIFRAMRDFDTPLQYCS